MDKIRHFKTYNAPEGIVLPNVKFSGNTNFSNPLAKKARVYRYSCWLAADNKVADTLAEKRGYWGGNSRAYGYG